MHEMSTMIRLVNQALSCAEKEGAVSVREMTVDVGEMTDIVPEYLQKYYPEATKGTILEGSRLITHVVPTKVHCLTCGTDFHPSKKFNYKCPTCGGIHCKVLKGRSVELASLKIES